MSRKFGGEQSIWTLVSAYPIIEYSNIEKKILNYHIEIVTLKELEQ